MSSLSAREKAELALSVKAKGSERPIEPMEVARRIELLIEETGSRENAAKALGFRGTTMIGRFLDLLSLPPTVADLIGWGGTNEGKLSVDMGYTISTMSSANDMEILVKAIVLEMSGKPITQKDVRSIVERRGLTPMKSMEDCIEEELKIRPIVEPGYLLVFNTDRLLRTMLRERAAAAQIEPDRFIHRMLCDFIESGGVESINFKDRFIYASFSEHAYATLKMKMQSVGIKPAMLIDYLLRDPKGSLVI